MIYIENILICLSAPMVIAILCVRKEARKSLMFLLTGMVACLATGTVAHGLPAVDSTGAIVLLVAVLVGTFGAYGLFLHGISLVGPVAGNMLGAAEPVSATVISALWLGTAFACADWAGLVLMVLTIFLIAWQSRT